MADGIEKIKTQLLELSRRYSTLRQVEDSNASSLAQLLKLMVKEEMTQSSDTENNTTTVVVKPAENGYHRGKFNSLECMFLPFSRRKEADIALAQFQTFPDLFVRPISVVDHEGKVYLAVEMFETIEHDQKPSDERNELLKNILRIGIKLDLHNQLNDGFERLVIANGHPKLRTPSNRNVNLATQRAQLKNIMRNIVRTGCEDQRHLRHFFLELGNATTMTRLRDCVYHPLLLTSSERVFYISKCMLVMHATNSLFEHKRKLNQRDTSWKPKIRASGCLGLIATLDHRTYGDTIFEWYRCSRNFYNHGNDKPLMDQNGNLGYPYEDVYKMTNDLESVFPNLYESMHTYMCARDLYDQFEGRENRDGVQLAINSKMKKLTRDLPNIYFTDFLDVIDAYDFVLAKMGSKNFNSLRQSSHDGVREE